MSDEATSVYDAIIVGAGFGGISTLHELRRRGLRARVLEAGSDVGGTWYWNRYPGARCDVEVFDYSFSFSPELEQEWDWSERYAGRDELQRYLRHVVDRFDLADDIQVDTRVTSAVYDTVTSSWAVSTEAGETFTARHVVMATGCLSSTFVPEFEGLSDFRGELYHTGVWPESGVDLRGKRVGVIGTGSSGVQVIPAIAPEVDHLYVFQRTPNHVVPAQNRPMDDAWRDELKRTVAERRAAAAATYFGISLETSGRATADATDEEREAEYERRWNLGGLNMLLSFSDVMLDEEANRRVADFIARKVRETVEDPEVAELLVPADHPVGTKRICVGTDYYETFNRDNVTLLDARTAPIERFTATGIRTAQGDVELDVVILATGYDAFTGALTRIDIRGRDGIALRDKWADGPKTYLGLGTAGFPNLFVVAGAGSPSVLSNMPISCQQHGVWIAETLAYLRDHELVRIEAEPNAEDAWTQHLLEVAGFTLHRLGNSWYQGANVPGKPRVFMCYLGGVPGYAAKLAEVAANGYEGFVLTPARLSEAVPA